MNTLMVEKGYKGGREAAEMRVKLEDTYLPLEFAFATSYCPAKHIDNLFRIFASKLLRYLVSPWKSLQRSQWFIGSPLYG